MIFLGCLPNILGAKWYFVLYGFCLSESGTGSTNQRFCLEQGVILFAIPTLEHGWGYFFAARIVLQTNIVAAVPARVPLHVYSNMPFPIRRSTMSHIFQSGAGYLFS